MTPPADINAEVDTLNGLGLEDLRAVWTTHFGPPPKLRSADLLRLMLAWRLQARRLGGLDRDTRRVLARRGPVTPEGSALGEGAILRRDWQGQRIEVVVEAGGFRWENKQYSSLSAIARKVTGTRWNGPKFFGLREVKL